ncbi:MAG TPA: glycosyltransferase [Anaerolineales bacterium]
MRIGMMADIYKTTVSGVTNSITLSKQWLEKAGHEVFIFTFGDNEVIDHEKNVIRTVGIPLVDTGFYLNLRYNRHARHLLYTMDIAHIHHPFVSGSLAMRYCVPRNIPIVYTNHSRYDLYVQAYVPVIPEQISDAALKAYLSPFYRACDLVIIPAPSMKQVLQQLYGLVSPVEVIPNGLDLAPFRSISQPIDRSVFGFSPDHVIYTYLGRLAPEKNLSMFLRAFYGVAMTYDHVRLLFVGDGPDRENLEAQVKHMNLSEKVYFTGMVEYKFVPNYLACSDIFVTPSRTETFGLSTVEAMASGLPVIGLDKPGTTDIVEDGITGLISPDDVAALTGKLILLATNHELRKKLGQQAIIASKKYDIQSTTSTLLEHYQRLIETAKIRKHGVRQKVTRLLDKIQ